VIHIINALPKTKWQNYVAQHPQGNIFHTPEMFEVFSHSEGFMPSLWAAVDDQEEVLALLLPVKAMLKSRLPRFVTTRAVVYGSVLYDHTPAGEEALNILLKTYRRRGGGDVLFTELRNLTNLSAAQPILQSNGFAYEEHLDYLIDLDCSVDQVMQNIGQRTRKQIRRALSKKEVTVEQVTRREQVKKCYELIQRTYLAAHMPLADISLFEMAFEVLYPRGMITFWTASAEGQQVACSVELPYKKVVYGWYSGLDRAFAKYTPNEILMWHVLRWSVEHGHTVYDFGGAGRPEEEYGVRTFKAKFGGKLVCYGRNTCVHHPLILQMSRLGYRLYRHFGF